MIFIVCQRVILIYFSTKLEMVARLRGHDRIFCHVQSLIAEIDCLKKITMDNAINSAIKTIAQTKLDKLVDIVFNLALDFSNLEDRLNLTLADQHSELNLILNITLPKNPYLTEEKQYISYLRHNSTAGSTQPFSLDVLGSMVSILLNGQIFPFRNDNELNELLTFITGEYIKLYEKCEQYSELDWNSANSEHLYDEINAIISSTTQLLCTIRERDQDCHIPVDDLLLCEEISTAAQNWINKIAEERRSTFLPRNSIF